MLKCFVPLISNGCMCSIDQDALAGRFHCKDASCFLEVVVQQPLFSSLLLSYIPGGVLGAG